MQAAIFMMDFTGSAHVFRFADNCKSYHLHGPRAGLS